MRKFFVITAAAVAMAFLFTGCDSNANDTAKKTPSPEWVNSLKQAKDAKQLFVVAGVGKTTAYISMHQKDEKGNWNQILSTPGYIGKNGLGKTKEGDGKTPVGTFKFNYAFGIEDDLGCKIKYHKVTKDDYWSGDVREGYHYNQMVSIKDFPDLDKDSSEHIIDYKYHYKYCLNISYNDKCKLNDGSAIFLHCLGPEKPYTGGCVALPQNIMEQIMKNVDKDCVVIIDTLENIAPDTKEKWGL